MARDQINFENYLYVDDNGVSWTKRGAKDGPATAVDGHATSTSAPRWINSAQQKTRTITYLDSTTGRKVDPVFYTAAAFAAVALGDIIAVPVAGLATTVNYTADKKNAERQARRGTIATHDLL